MAVGYKVAVLKERLPLDQLSSRRCPPQLKKLVRKCWEQDPLRRPAAAEMVKELLTLLQQVKGLDPVLVLFHNGHCTARCWSCSDVALA